MQTSAYGGLVQPDGTNGLDDTGNREVEPETRGPEHRARINSSRPGRKACPQPVARSVSGGCQSKSLAQDGGGQGALFRLKEKGLQADRACGRTTPTQSDRKQCR